MAGAVVTLVERSAAALLGVADDGPQGAVGIDPVVASKPALAADADAAVGPDDEVEGAVARGVGAHLHPAVVRAHGGHRHAGCTNPGSACPLDITGSLDLDGGHARDQDRGRLRRGRVELPGRAAAGSWCRGPGSTAYQIPSTAGTAPNFVAPTAAVTVPAAGRFSQLSPARERPQRRCEGRASDPALRRRRCVDPGLHQ